MGCGGSREKETGVHAHLDHWMATVGIEKIDEVFTEAKGLIQSIEGVRVAIVDNRDALVISSGACSYVEPKMSDCFMGVCWKLSADNKGKILDAGFSVEKEIKLEGKNNSADAKKAVEDLEAYVKGVVDLSDKMTAAAEGGKMLATKLAENAVDMTNQVAEAFKDKPLQLPGKIKDIKSNIDKCNNAATCIAKLVEEMEGMMSFFQTLPKILSEFSKIDEIGEKAHKAKHVKAYEITWANITDPKMKYGKKAEDGYQFWMRRRDTKKATKDANANKK